MSPVTVGRGEDQRVLLPEITLVSLQDYRKSQENDAGLGSIYFEGYSCRGHPWVNLGLETENVVRTGFEVVECE